MPPEGACSIIDCRLSRSRSVKSKGQWGRGRNKGFRATREGHSNRRALTPAVHPKQGRYYPRLFGVAKASSGLEETFRPAPPPPVGQALRRRVPGLLVEPQVAGRAREGRSKGCPRTLGLTPSRGHLSWPKLAPRLFRPYAGREQIIRFQTPHTLYGKRDPPGRLY